MNVTDYDPDWYQPESIEARRQVEESYKRWIVSKRKLSEIPTQTEIVQNSPAKHFSLVVQHTGLFVRSCLRHLKNRTIVGTER
jgi:hypothetical protein